MSVNKTAMQNVRQHHFLQPKGLWVKYAHKGNGNGNTLECDKPIDLTHPPDSHIWVTLLDVFLHISSEKDIKDIFC
jgi:hypothetical protein